MAYDTGRNMWNPLILGAIAVIAALVAFLLLRDGLDANRQAGIERLPPATTTPAPPSPTTPPSSTPRTVPPAGGSGTQ